MPGISDWWRARSIRKHMPRVPVQTAGGLEYRPLGAPGTYDPMALRRIRGYQDVLEALDAGRDPSGPLAELRMALAPLADELAKAFDIWAESMQDTARAVTSPAFQKRQEERLGRIRAALLGEEPR